LQSVCDSNTAKITCPVTPSDFKGSVSADIENNSLIIENPIKLRSNIADSTKTGLKNIEMRYTFYTDEKVIVMNNGKVFKVILPLIQRK
jgi:hypothetical protein